MLKTVQISRALLVVIMVVAMVVAAGCGPPASPTEPPPPTAAPQQVETQPAAQPQPTAAAEAMGIAPTQAPAAPQASGSSQSAAEPASPSPTAIPIPAAMPETESSGKDSIVVVIPTEPDALSPWSTGSAETSSIVVHNWGEALVWLNTTTLELGPTTSTTGWEQVAPDRWRFSLREGVKFVNGEPWNATTAAWNINHNGDPQVGLGFGVHGPMTGEVVDEMTLDITCAHANYNDGASQNCPILPGDITSVAYQAPEWWQSTEADVRERATVGFGAYKMAEYVPGQYVDSEAYEDYVPSGRDDLPRPAIPNVRYVWRLETPVRSAMIQTGEADHTYLLNVEDIPKVPQAISVPQWEVEGFFHRHPVAPHAEADQVPAGAGPCHQLPGNSGRNLQFGHHLHPIARGNRDAGHNRA